MSDVVVDLAAYKEKLNAPDADQVYVDADGVSWFKFGIEYTDGRGKTMTSDLWALSLDDAHDRLALLKDNGRVYGQIVSEIQE